MFDIDENAPVAPAPALPAAPAAAAPAGMLADPRIAAAMQDPMFKQRLADRMKALADAQAEGEDRAKRASWGNALMAFGGGDTAGGGSRIDAARGAPLNALKQRWDLEDAQQQASVAHQQAALDNDPASDKSKGAQAFFRHYNPGLLPDELLGRSSFAQLAQYEPRLKALSDVQRTDTQSGKDKADTAKLGAETPEIAPNAQSERALKAAQANEANAKAAEARLKAPTTLEVAPGWVRTKPMTPEQETKFRDQVISTNNITNKVDELTNLLGDDSNSILTGPNRGKAETTVKKLLLDIKGQSGLKLNPGTERMVDEMIGDPTKPSAFFKDMVGLNHFREKVTQFKKLTQQDLDNYAHVNGIVQMKQPDQQQPKNEPKNQPAPAALARFHAQLQPGERLAVGPKGEVVALAANEQAPAGYAVQ